MPCLSLHSPAGDLTIFESEGAVVALEWGWASDQALSPLLIRARDQLHAYFDQELAEFDLPLRPQGTPYQLKVWRALRDIPYGQTRTYGGIAVVAGGSPRAVGRANAANPIPILIPCHRVLASAGAGGYSGGEGLATKHLLLQLESAQLARELEKAT